MNAANMFTGLHNAARINAANYFTGFHDAARINAAVLFCSSHDGYCQWQCGLQLAEMLSTILLL